MTTTPITPQTLIPTVTPRPAGGDDPNQFDLTEAWYPVYYLTDLDRKKLHKFTLLGQDIVIWWDAHTAQWSAVADQCPHRLAPLSEGRINEQGWLECPYHGWAFQGTGECAVIPQQPEGGQAHQAKRACVKTYPTVERQGLLFIYAGKAENAPQTQIPLVEPLLDEDPQWFCLDTFRDIPYDATTLLENVLDASHVNYTHHKTIGNRANAKDMELEVQEAGKQGFKGFWAEGPRRGKLGPQYTTFLAPNLMWQDITSKQFGRTLTVVYATPIRKGECRLFARFPFKFSSAIPRFVLKLTPRWYSHINQHRILEDDQIFLHYQERYLQKIGGEAVYEKACYLPTQADTYVAAFRQWLTQFNAYPFAEESLSPAWPTEQLLERYHSHTVHCASCRKALKQIQWVRFGSAIALLLLLISSPILVETRHALSSIGNNAMLGILGGSGIVSLLLAGFWWKLGQLEEKFYQGPRIPPRNLD